MIVVTLTKDAAPWHRREVGVADGLSKEYAFHKGNKHQVEMTVADADKLRDLIADGPHADEFAFGAAKADAGGK